MSGAPASDADGGEGSAGQGREQDAAQGAAQRRAVAGVERLNGVARGCVRVRDACDLGEEQGVKGGVHAAPSCATQTAPPRLRRLLWSLYHPSALAVLGLCRRSSARPRCLVSCADYRYVVYPAAACRPGSLDPPQSLSFSRWAIPANTIASRESELLALPANDRFMWRKLWRSEARQGCDRVEGRLLKSGVARSDSTVRRGSMQCAG